jgi:hypothetical protein
MESNYFQPDQCQEFAKLRRLVRAGVHEVSTQVPSNVYQLSNDCNGDKLKLHSPNCDRRHVILELHDRLKLRLLGSKHNVHRHARKLHDVKVGLRDDMEFLQIYLI